MVFYKWPLYGALIYNCLVVNSAYDTNLKTEAHHIPSTVKKQLLGEISQNIQKAVILLSMVAGSQNCVRQ